MRKKQNSNWWPIDGYAYCSTCFAYCTCFYHEGYITQMHPICKRIAFHEAPLSRSMRAIAVEHALLVTVQHKLDMGLVLEILLHNSQVTSCRFRDWYSWGGMHRHGTRAFRALRGALGTKRPRRHRNLPYHLISTRLSSDRCG